MKRIKPIHLLIISIALATSGCSTIEFIDSEAKISRTEEYSAWHHNFALSLLEVSDPVDLSECTKGWHTVIVERSIVTALAGSLDNLLVGTLDVWDPQSVRLYCQ